MAKKNFWNRTYKWSWADALGDTVMEKYESLYVSVMKVAEYCGELRYVICSKEVASIFETATCGYEPEPYTSEWEDIKLPERDCYRSGRINNKFDIYIDTTIPKNVMFVCGSDGVHKIEVLELF